MWIGMKLITYNILSNYGRGTRVLTIQDMKREENSEMRFFRLG
jgi:hypothetical protein